MASGSSRNRSAGSRGSSSRYARLLSGGGGSSPDLDQLPSASSGGGGAAGDASLVPRPSSPSSPRARRRRLARNACACVILFPWSALLALFGLQQYLWRGPTVLPADLPGARKCVGWRETYFCHPFAERFSPGDKGCDARIGPQVSGYCLCEGNVTAARAACGPKSFTCRDKCAELAYNPTDALELPKPISCPYELPYAPRDYAPEAVRRRRAVERANVAAAAKAAGGAFSAAASSSLLVGGGRSGGRRRADHGEEDDDDVSGREARLGAALSAFNDSNRALPSSSGRRRGGANADDDATASSNNPWADLLVDAAAARAAVTPSWEALWAAVHSHAVPPQALAVPWVRNETHDFVREKRRLPAQSVAAARSALDAFLSAVPSYPSDAFKGRGIVFVGGGLRYLVPAWIGVHMLRAAGCTLPIEMFYPLSEYPPSGAVAAFAALGVTTRGLDFKGLDIPEPFAEGARGEDPQNMARFTIKVAALVLSSFEEVIYLDSDNIPVRDPADLLRTPEYNATGALLWQDFWANTMAPEAEQLLGLPRERWFEGSFESGQMVLDKRRHWRGLSLAVYLNAHAALYYEVFTCYLGKGDKETFAYALAAAGESYSVVSVAPAALGTTGTSMRCDARTHLCVDEFTGNTMVQHSPDGKVFFLHSNLHKWDLRLPEKFSLHYQRRWQAMLVPGGARGASSPRFGGAGLKGGGVDFERWALREFGYDVERRVYELVRQLACTEWWPSYHAARAARGDRRTPDLDGFHFLLRGIELDKMYRLGWGGVYEELLEGRLTARDRLLHRWRKGARPRLVGWGLLKAPRPA